MDELKPGLWTWTAPHPAWTPEEGGPEGWERAVRSYAYEAGDALVLFDPLVAVERVEELAAGRPVAVILTCHGHGRSSAELVEKLAATVHGPVEHIEGIGVQARRYEVGEDLPGDVEPQVGAYTDEATLWLREHAALVTGDVFLGGAQGFRVQPDPRLAEGLTHEVRVVATSDEPLIVPEPPMIGGPD